MRFRVLLLAVMFLGLPPVSLAQQAGTPTKITHVDPVYPEQARQARVQGIVMLQITVGTNGRVSSARVIRSVPMLDQAALDAVKQWVYDAASIKAPVTFTVTVPFGVAAPPAAIAQPPSSGARPETAVVAASGSAEPANASEMNSRGVEAARRKDFPAALTWYRRAADRGNATAMCNIATMYGSGQGVERNDAVAFEWSLKCAEGGSAHGMYRVSNAYDPELPLYPTLPKDAVKSFSWALKAANLGHVQAMRSLARMYGTGRGTKQDSAEANRWMQMSYKETKEPLGAPGNRGM